MNEVHNDWLFYEEQEQWEQESNDDAKGDMWKLYPSNHNLTNYYYFSSVFSAGNVEEILKLLSPSFFQQGNVTSSIDPSYRRSKIQWIKRNKSSFWLYRFVMFYAIKANNAMFGFNITNAFEHIQYAQYDAGDQGFYDYHVDLGVNNISSCRKLTVVVQLSKPDEYEGGELCIKASRSDMVCPKEQGTIIVFPSYLLHTVKPVTRGTRKSLVVWLHGPSFK